MKPLKLIEITFMCLFFLYSCDNIKENEEFTELPQKSESGINTLGCYIDGKLFVNSKKTVFWKNNPIGATYSKDLRLLSLGADSKSGASISLLVLNPKENVRKKINEVIYYPTKKNESSYIFGGKEIGEIILTKFDTINMVVSGQFQFPGHSRFSNESFKHLGDSVINVTSGRFDIQLAVH